MSTVHELKCWPEAFSAVWSGDKCFEYRRDDRGGYVEGDALHLREWDPTTERYTGRELICPVTYVVRGTEFGVPAGYCVMSIELRAWRNDDGGFHGGDGRTPTTATKG